MKNIQIVRFAKKSTAILAAAIAATSVVAEELKPTFKAYGSARIGVNSVDANIENDGADGRDFLSRFRVKGSQPINDNLKAVGHIEYGSTATQKGSASLRLQYFGLEGDFGKLYYGSQTTVWHKFVRSAYFSDGTDSLRGGAIRDDDMLQYYYKNGGLTLGLAAQTENRDGDDIDQYQIGAEYKTGGAKFQAALQKDNRGDNNGTLLGLRAWYTAGNFTVSAMRHAATDDFDLHGFSSGYTSVSVSSSTTTTTGFDLSGNPITSTETSSKTVGALSKCSGEDQATNALYGRYKSGSNQIHARYAINDCEDSGDVSSIKVEYVRFLGKKARVWASYETFDSDDGRLPSTGDDMSAFQIGGRVDFSS